MLNSDGFTADRTKEEKRCRGEVGVGYCPFSSSSRGTVYCVAIGKVQVSAKEHMARRDMA